MTLQSRFFNSPSRDLDQALNATTASNAARATSTVKPVAVSASQPSAADAAPTSPTGKPASTSRLTVGPHIKLKGVEITDCDTLVVEGSVQASMDSRVMQIAEGGAFTGSAQIDEAEIRGDFDGQLTARHKLMLYATAKVKGQIRYGKLVMEEGAQLSGDVAYGTAATLSQPAPMLKAA
ncbi:polymer-forming cytoskeletal protein [Variovorax sp. PCZ-1]|uniref:bactofilin family protein n=1 Tax=Variovorax sp. PCZ-1 TaxID=2835533 RepID=UPI001BCC754B|nr:polymer-forming cytoskeletal protein [Variovorax sp. PCZ-1]MBS7807692.1 polymer-forming cytoskeletal protein [Variovorax sp. PCZ-1]